jgi:DNA-binding CsgD family transcriptional regulator
MEDTSLLAEKDVRAIVRLLGETCTKDGTLNEKKHSLMAGLGRLLDSQAWAWVHAVEMKPGELPVYAAYISGGFSEEALARFIKIQTHPDMARLSTSLSVALQGRTRPLTRTLQQLMPIEDFYTAEVAEEWRACGIYPRALHFYPLADGTFSGIAIYRDCDKPVLTPREAKLAHVILSSVPWLHAAQGAAGEQTTQVPNLPVRERLVLELLLQGYSRKAIASTMGISINTVAGYAKNIYRFFNVASHGELSRLFRLS